MTLHPSFVAKSYFPKRLLQAAGFESVGSRPRDIVPELITHSEGTHKYATRPGSEPQPTTELFLESKRTDLQAFARHIQDEGEVLTPAEEEIVIVEGYRLPSTAERSRLPAELLGEVPLEIVLHAAGDARYGFVLESFESFALGLGAIVDLDRRLAVGQLCFVPAQAPVSKLSALAEFSFLRVMRPMPRLRVIEPVDTPFRTVRNVDISLPADHPVDTDLKVAVFDGGIKSPSPLDPWVSNRDTTGKEAPSDQYVEHGTAVTSAFLFGSVDPTFPIPVPYAHVDHYRVIDGESENDPWELYDVIRRIESVLAQNSYSFINLSIGPALPIEDDEVHSWTAFIDNHLADGRTLATIAVGNGGENDRPSGNARIQVPADAVNALSVGAASSQRKHWDRTPYSSIGPGRAPGIVKPDVLAFGGVPAEPFVTVSTCGTLLAVSGTSYAAPVALRSAVAVRSLFGDRLDPLLLKALLIHTAEQLNQWDPKEHGWGRVCPEIEPIIMCGDGTARVLYRGSLTPAKYLRAQLPIPSETLKGNVRITATLTFSTAVEPEQPSNYTRSGVDVVFRPDRTRFSSANSIAPKSAPFFGKRLLPADTQFRADAHRWETVLHGTVTKRGSSLNHPVFDIHYNARLGGHDGTAHASSIRYGMVITVESKRTPDLHDRVLRTYVNQLEALVPRADIPLRVQATLPL
ncbi:MAG: S8 family peptidase [Acidimicrobiia bacterium]|nr:S8 family peptidase [Acidimicrobiia bacterium]